MYLSLINGDITTMRVLKIISYGIFSVITVTALLLLILYFTQTSDYEVTQITNCQSDAQVQVYCDFNKPEDIVVLPDDRHLLISEFGAIVPLSPKNLPGQLSLFDTDTLSIISKHPTNPYNNKQFSYTELLSIYNQLSNYNGVSKLFHIYKLAQFDQFIFTKQFNSYIVNYY